MIPYSTYSNVVVDYLSRVCGDDPKFLCAHGIMILFVPRMRG